MLKKILRALLILVLLLVILLAGAVVYVDLHLRSSEEKLLQDFAETQGLDVAFRQTNLRVWKHFPQVSLFIDSLVIRDTLLPPDAPALLAVDRLETRLNLGALLRDTVKLEAISIKRGSLYLVADANGTFNAGRLLQPKRKSVSPPPSVSFFLATPLFTYDNSLISLDDIEVTYGNPLRNKRIEVAVDSIRTNLNTLKDGGVKLSTQLAARVGQLALNTEKGAYLRNSPLSGYLEATFGREEWIFSPTPLRIGGQTFELSATISRTPGALSHIYVANDSTEYDAALALMPESLRTGLAEFHATGHFPARAHLLTTLERGDDTEVRIDLTLSGQDVRVRQYDFRRVSAEVSIVNRLDEADHGIPGSRKNLRVDLRKLSGDWGNIHLAADTALVMAFGEDTRIKAPLRFSGPTSAVSTWLKNENFFFEGGRFDLDVAVDASLLDYEEMIVTTDGTLRLSDMDIEYRPAGVRFPFQEIRLSKITDDIGFHVQSRPLETGFIFALDGKLDNLTPLLIDVPGARLRSQVALYAPRVDWAHFLAFFGKEGTMASQKDSTLTPPDNQAVKKTLLGLRETFQPTIEARFDTVSYYDVFTLSDFTTGLHFASDTLVLERTAFNWAGSEVAFGARLDLAGDGETAFGLDVATDHLDLNQLRPTLDHFGLQLPAGLETLPDDLHVRFAHEGIIDDTMGIKPGFNLGNLDFNDGRSERFRGNMNYRPGVTGLATNFHLAGDPAFVNDLFGAKEFFFGSGSFAIDLALEGTPADLPALVANSKMALQIDSSRITYRPGQVYVPIQQFRVAVDQGAATYSLQLLNDATRREVSVTGELDRLASFLYPTPGDVYRVETNISASLLHLSDITGFIQSDTSGVRADTLETDTRQVLSATGGIFGSFRPELSVTVDSFYATDATLLTDVRAGLYLRDSTTLVLERSGFTLGDGTLELAATYRLDEEVFAPFTADLRIEKMDIQQLGQTLAEFSPTLADQLSHADGKIDISGRLTGRLDERNEQIMYEHTSGTLTYALTELEFNNWLPLLDLGKKIKMRRRFENLKVGPLTGTLEIDSGRVLVPRTEIQSTALQLFVEGRYDLQTGPDLLITVPLKNIGRGLLDTPPSPTGYARAGWKVFLVTGSDEEGKLQNKFRFGNRRYFKSRGRLEEYQKLRLRWQEERKSSRKR